MFSISLRVWSLGPQLVVCFGRLKDLEELKPYWEVGRVSRHWGIRAWPHFLSVLFFQTPDAMWPATSYSSCHTFLSQWTVSPQTTRHNEPFPLGCYLLGCCHKNERTKECSSSLFCKNIISVHNTSSPLTSSPPNVSSLMIDKVTCKFEGHKHPYYSTYKITFFISIN